MKRSSSALTALKVEKLSKHYEGKILLNELSFTVGPEEILCLLGPSGSGKSTLLRIIAGLEPFESGRLFWHGQNLIDIATEKRSFGLMFQEYALFPHLNVFENVAFGLRMKHHAEPLLSSKVNNALDLVGMLRFAHRKVQNLSGGEQQRIALARTLAPEPKLIMLDEPLGALDRKLREQLILEIRQILKSLSMPAIYVTHDQEEAFMLADRILLLANGELAQIGTSEQIFRHPASSWVAGFLGLGNVVKGVILSIRPLVIRTALADIHCQTQYKENLKAGKTIILLVRPDSVDTNPNGKNSFRGIVVDCIFQGNHYKTSVNVNDASYTFSLAEKHRPGETILLSINEKKVDLLETIDDPKKLSGIDQ